MRFIRVSRHATLTLALALTLTNLRDIYSALKNIN